ncbi:GH23248 [Drosophila grimshawi]|uniref:GH23248 n=1 Tax=Drosophila grimshawi TaxID=7222 RepID=B4K3J1_DROGR|nr:GH23248 [Drosophila grimshawi]
MGKKGKKGKGKKSKGKKKATIVAPATTVVHECAPCPQPPVFIQPLDPCPESSGPHDVFRAQPNHYPALLRTPETMAVVGSENGCYDSICKLLRAGFRCAERVFLMAPWGNYVLFRFHSNNDFIYFLYDGCTCDVNRFRYLDLSCGTAGFLFFSNMHDAISYILQSRKTHLYLESLNKIAIDQIVEEYGAVTYTQKAKCMRFS